MFITPAYAQGAGGSAGGILELLFPLLMVGVIMWFLVIRPQRQQQKRREEMLSNVRRNDTVITGGGIVGKVTKVVDDSEVEVQIAPDVKVRILRSMLADVRVKGEPVKEKEAAPAKQQKKPSRKAPAKKAPADEKTAKKS